MPVSLKHTQRRVMRFVLSVGEIFCSYQKPQKKAFSTNAYSPDFDQLLPRKSCSTSSKSQFSSTSLIWVRLFVCVATSFALCALAEGRCASPSEANKINATLSNAGKKSQCEVNPFPRQWAISNCDLASTVNGAWFDAPLSGFQL